MTKDLADDLERLDADNFNGDNAALVRSITALIALNKRAAFPNPVPGLAVQLLTSAAHRLSALRGEEWQGIERFTDSERLWLITAANLLENNPDKPGPSPFHDHQVMARKLRQMASPSPSPERN